MIFKLIGCAAIFGASTVLGLSKANEFKRRAETLSCFSDAAGLLATEIRFAQTMLPEALKRVGENTKGEVGEFFKTCASILCEQAGITVSAAWSSALDLHMRSMAIKREDVSVIQSLGTCLGGSDITGQLGAIGAFREKIAIHSEDAQSERNKNAKLYTNLGIYAGLLICILLF